MKCYSCGRVLNFWSVSGLCDSCVAASVKPGPFTAVGKRLPRLRRVVEGPVVFLKNHLSLNGFATLAGWITVLFWVNVVGCGGFAGQRGFPLAYETWTDDAWPFTQQYPWAIALDVAFAAGSIVLIAFLVRRRVENVSSGGTSVLRERRQD